MTFTNKGKKWELLNSLWIVWSFIPLFNWIGFMWIGARANRKKWLLYGFIYLLTGFVQLAVWIGIIINDYENEQETGISITIAIFLIIFVFWFASMIHSLVARKEYLIRREAIVDALSYHDLVVEQDLQPPSMEASFPPYEPEPFDDMEPFGDTLSEEAEEAAQAQDNEPEDKKISRVVDL